MTVPGAKALAQHIKFERELHERLDELDAMYPDQDTWSEAWHLALWHVREFMIREEP